MALARGWWGRLRTYLWLGRELNLSRHDQNRRQIVLRSVQAAEDSEKNLFPGRGMGASGRTSGKAWHLSWPWKQQNWTL